MDDVLVEANLGGCFLTQTWSRPPLIWVISKPANMPSQNGDVAMVSSDNGVGNVDAYIQSEYVMIVFMPCPNPPNSEIYKHE